MQDNNVATVLVQKSLGYNEMDANEWKRLNASQRMNLINKANVTFYNCRGKKIQLKAALENLKKSL